MADEIMQELWAVKDAIAEETGYDLDKLCQLLKQWQTEDTKRSQPVQAVDDARKS